MRLTSLANVRAWVGSQSGQTTDDALLTRLIAEASETILNYLQRADLGKTTLTEIKSGRDELRIRLRNWPVLSMTGLRINGQTIPESTGAAVYGYYLEKNYGSNSGRAQNVGIRNFNNNPYPVGTTIAGYGTTAYMPTNAYNNRPFPKGIGNIEADYSYGYSIENEPATIPEAVSYTVNPQAPNGSWGEDLGVTFADGTPLTRITSGTPTTGQYLPPDLTSSTPRLVYTFAAADAGKSVLLSYNYVPFSIEQACIEMVGERYRYKSRIGLSSTSMNGQETASYVLDGMTKAILSRLDPYRLLWGG